MISLFLLTGLFTALKVSDLEKAMKMVEYSFETISDGNIYEISFFVKRCLSIFLIIGLLFIFSLNKWCLLFGYILICYRAFLITLNCVLLIRYVGIGGIVNTIIIILPCQIIQILLIGLIFIMLCVCRCEKRDCGVCDKKHIPRQCNR